MAGWLLAFLAQLGQGFPSIGRGPGVEFTGFQMTGLGAQWVISPQLTDILLFLLIEGFARRKKISLWFVGSLLLVSTLILTIGLAATTRTENVTVGGYYPGIIVSQRPMGDWAGCSVFYVERHTPC